MVQAAVKRKFGFFERFLPPKKSPLGCAFVLLGLLSFIFSLLPIPTPLVERWFSLRTFPTISALFAPIADAIGIAWLDVLLVVAIVYLILCIWRRRWMAIAVTISIGYLIFFWTWGLNYHREPLLSKLTTSPADMEAFTQSTAGELNSLYPEVRAAGYDEGLIRTTAADRVARVLEKLDGTRWLAPHRVKESFLADPWFRVAGIDGMFNPIAHEPIINSRVLDIERPFIIAHELAHVRGYPEEGEANFIALMACLLSEDPRFRYSGWMELWLYQRSRKTDPLLDSGPRQDVDRIYERLRREQVAWISNLQSAMLNVYLKTNNVPEGVRSYARIVTMAAETQPTWERFR